MLWEWRGIANMDFIQLGGSSRVDEMILARERSGFAGKKYGATYKLYLGVNPSTSASGSQPSVAFRQHTCFIRNLEGVDLLTGSRGNNLYTLSLGDMMASSPICLLSKASKTKSWLWHRRLSYLNFGAINHLARHGLVRGLPKLKFEKDHLCSACAMGKSKKKSHKPKSEDTNQEKLYLLHMDLCSPMRVASVNGKKYILVIVDDYSRFTWVKCLRSKDEAPDFIIKFLKMIQLRLKAPVRRIRTDNGTEFVNQTLREYYEKVGISHETSVARSPQQNGVVERRNRTLIEAARTMLIYAKAPLFLWAEAVATAYFDELTAMASEHGSLEPALHEMTLTTISSGLVSNPTPSTLFPNLFQLKNESFNFKGVFGTAALTKYINTLNWDRPAFYYDDDDDDDDEESSIPLSDFISEHPPCVAITPVLSTEEPDNSLSMGDEHLDTIPATESNKIIKSSVENLVQGLFRYRIHGGENEDNVFNPGILASNEEKSPHLLSYRGFKAFQLISKSPMMISGEDIPILDEIGKSSRIDEEVVQDQRQRDDNDLQDERQDQPKEEEKINYFLSRSGNFLGMAQWKEAIKSEIDFILQNHNWELVDLLLGCKLLSYKWIFKKKIKVDGTIDKYKARLAIKGFRQQGLCYFDTYSTRITRVKMILAIAALRNSKVNQIYVKMTFLKGDLEKVLYMNQPEGFMAPGLESKVASVSVMPLSIYLNLGLGELAHTKLTVELAYRTVKYSKGIAENVLVGIGKFVFPVDFVILDMPEDIKVPLILGRPFLSIARAKIDVFKRKITLRVGEERIIFKSVKPASSLIKRVYMLSLRERMELDLEARLMGETLVLNRSLDPLNGDYIELNDLNEPFELRRDQGDDLMPTIKEGEVIKEFRTRDDELDTEIDDYPSYCDYDKKIHIDYARNLKFSCMIGFEFIHVNFFPLLYVNVMSKKFHNSIMNDKMVNNGNNVVVALMNVPIFVITFSVVTDFVVLEDMDAYRDEGMGDVIFGEPFLREVGIKARWFEGMITIYNGNESDLNERKEIDELVEVSTILEVLES
ncbi:putative reverse transcriptase domain-containing protein [Tanacetum coccineum]